MLERTLSENLAALGRVGARGLEALLADVSADGTVETSADVVVGVSLRGRAGIVRMHGRGDQVAEAARALPDELGPLVVLLGAGAGYVIDALEDRGFAGRVLLLEPSAASLKAMLSRRSWQALVEAGRLRLLAGPDYSGWMELPKWVGAIEGTPPLVVHPVIARERPDEVRRAADLLERLLFNAEANEAARKHFAGPYLLNTLGNLRHLVESRDVAELFGQFAGVPAFVLAAGPSLNRNLEALRPHRDRALVVAVDTALRPSLAQGVEPDLVVGVDPGEANLRHLSIGGAPLRTHLVAEPSLAPGSFDAFAGRVFTFRVARHHPWPWLQEHGIDRAQLLAWGSVLTTALDLTVRLGCNPVVLFGADFAYTDGQPYCRGTAFEDDWARQVEAGAPIEQVWRQWMRQPTVVERGIDGREVETSTHLQAFRDWVVEFCGKHPEVEFVNGTGAGVLRAFENLREAHTTGRSVFDALSRGVDLPRVRALPQRAARSVPDLPAAVQTLLGLCCPADCGGWPVGWAESVPPAALWQALRQLAVRQPDGSSDGPISASPSRPGAHPPNPRRTAEYYRLRHAWQVDYQNNNWLLEELDSIRSLGAGRILELGCGNGRFLAAAATSFNEVCGCDWAVSPQLSNVLAAHPNVTFECVDLYENTPGHDADVVVSADFLEHLTPESLPGVMQRIDSLGASAFHKIACYDDGHSHLSIFPPGEWLRRFKAVNPAYRLDRVGVRLGDQRRLVAVISKGNVSDVEPAGGGARLYFGREDRCLPGYVHANLRIVAGAKVSVSAAGRMGFEPGSVQSLHWRHTLQLLERADAELALTWCHDVLKPGGRLRLVVPDLTFHAKQLLGHEVSWAPAGAANFAHAMAGFYGWRAPVCNDVEEQKHRWGYTWESLTELLVLTGFSEPWRMLSGRDSEPWQLHVSARKGT